MLWNHKLIDEAAALSELGDFLTFANADDVDFLRDILKEKNSRPSDSASDLRSIAVSSILPRSLAQNDQHEHAFLMLIERLIEVDTETLRDMAKQLPAKRGRMGRLNSRQRCRMQSNIRSLAVSALDDSWPLEVPRIEIEAAEEPKEKPTRRSAAKAAPKAKSKAKPVARPASARSRRRTSASN